MYDNAIPVYEMKNRLSFYLHKTEEDGPVFISNRGKPEFVLMTVEDYEKQIQNAPKKKSIFEAAAELRKKYGLEDDDFDFSEHLQKLREEEPRTSRREEEFLKEWREE